MSWSNTVPTVAERYQARVEAGPRRTWASELDFRDVAGADRRSLAGRYIRRYGGAIVVSSVYADTYRFQFRDGSAYVVAGVSPQGHGLGIHVEYLAIADFGLQQRCEGDDTGACTCRAARERGHDGVTFPNRGERYTECAFYALWQPTDGAAAAGRPGPGHWFYPAGSVTGPPGWARPAPYLHRLPPELWLECPRCGEKTLHLEEPDGSFHVRRTCLICHRPRREARDE